MQRRSWAFWAKLFSQREKSRGFARAWTASWLATVQRARYAPHSLPATRKALRRDRDNSIRGSLALLLLGVLFGGAHAEIYTWVDAQGVRHYSDSADSRRAEHARLPSIQRADGDPAAMGKLLARQEKAGGKRKPVRSRTLVIVEPRPEQTIRDDEGVVPVAVTIGGGSELRAGEKITYYLDDNPIPQSPIERTQLSLGNVSRGTHRLSAALLYQDRELRRTQPVTFYMKLPAAISPLNDGQGGNPREPGDTTLDGASVVEPAGNTDGAPAAPRFNTTSTAAGSP